MSLELPQELIDAIIDHLSTDSPSLKACSLVRRLWLSRSRSHLFGTCNIDPKNILAFRDLLRSPHGCTFVRHVHSIRAMRWDWSPNDPCFDEILADLLLLTGVRTLDLELYIELHIRKFSGFSVTGSAAAAVPPQSLRSLHLNVPTTSLILSWLHACNHLPSVDSLTLPLMEREHAPVVRAALQQLGGALHYLDIIIGLAFDVDTLTVFDFSLHPNLRTLVIRCAFGDFNGMFSLISRLAVPTLERLAFNWAAVDAFLTPARFPACGASCLNLMTSNCTSEFLRETLPLLHAAGLLEIF
ncbi:hypothetical protein B0H13DRAFT_2063810 [Mycena leptocephala]|nr:hypothetical protein B0H13DRAFT_2063810 [Mycena leptocephala]